MPQFAFAPRPIRPQQLLALPLLLSLTGCLTPQVDVMPRVGRMNLDGEFASGVGSPGGENSFGSLGLEETKTVFMPRVDVASGRWNHTVDWIGASYGGSGTVENSFTLDGVTFGTGTPIQSDLNFGLGRWLATYDLASDPEWLLGVGGGLGIYSVETRIRAQFSGAESSTDQVGVAPTLALNLGYDWGDLEANLLAGWVGFSLNDTQVDYLDLDGHLRWYLRGPEAGISASLVAGYRWVSLDARYREEAAGERIDWQTTLQGPYLGFTIGF